MLAFYLALIDDGDDKAVFENAYCTYRKQMTYSVAPHKEEFKCNIYLYH